MVLHIDGSFGEGGGQILRTSLACSALLGKAVEIDNIRANRKKPGLRPQHLLGVRALASITGAEVSGAQEHSTRLLFVPGTIKGGDYRFDIGTAGSVTMVLAALLPPLLFASKPSTVTVTGGTHVPFSPPVHYITEIFLPALAAMGGKVSLTLDKWGWYPKGGGRITFTVTPAYGLSPCRLQGRGPLTAIDALIGLANLPDHIAEREETTISRILGRKEPGVRFNRIAPACVGQGNFVFLKATFAHAAAGFSAMGQRGRPAEEVAEEACAAFAAFRRTRAAADTHLADQLALYMALASGTSELRTEVISSHLRTNIWVLERFLPVTFAIAEESCRVSIRGADYMG